MLASVRISGLSPRENLSLGIASVRTETKETRSVRESDGKFKALQASQKVAAATRNEIIYDKLLEPGQTTMKRMRNTRKHTEALIEEAVASNVACQKWGKEMADAWRAANGDLLEFEEAALERIMEGSFCTDLLFLVTERKIDE